MAKKRKTLPKDFEAVCERGNLEELEEVFKKCDLEAYTGYSKCTAFSVSKIPGHFIKWLVDHGADINAVDSYQDTALHHHAKYWDSDIRPLLNVGADMEALDKGGNTPLFWAVTHGRTEKVAILLQHGADIHVKNRNGQTALEKGLSECANADISQMAEIADLLLAAGAHKTPEMQMRVEKIGQAFEFYRSSFNPEMLEETERDLAKLYDMFGVTPVAKRVEYDGSSLIEVKSIGWKAQHNELWELLVPGSGACKTAQGEVIRITGKVTDEMLRNGGVNWDRQYQAMAKALLKYFKMGNALSEDLLAETGEIIKSILDALEDRLYRMCELAVQWVLLNPVPIALGTPAYNR